MMDKMLGVMLDCSRNAVMSVDNVKKYADILSKMGYNTLMLYTEETYEVNNQPYFGHLRGRYSKEELKELDSYCNKIGIELVPCIQTLAHLEAMFKWYSVYNEINDCDNILLAGDEKTYKLTEDMISTLAECFSSKKIHIGMDEAYRVGTGKYQLKHGIKDRFDVINEHLHMVCDICAKYGLEAMIWSDMFCKLALNIESQYEHVDPEKILEKAQLPENVALVYWDYYSTDYDHYVDMIRTNKFFGRKVYFAGGAWTWNGFAPDNDFSMKSTSVALDACNNEGIDGIFYTEWGDNGDECSKFAVLPSLMYAAEVQKGNTDMDSIKEKFMQITGCDFDSFMLLDKLDKPGGKHEQSTSRYLLYNDVFMGIRDYLCDLKDAEFYEKLAEEIHNAPGKGEFSYLFDSYENLALVLSKKSTLGIRTRAAYLKGDMDEIRNIIADYEDTIGKIEKFHEVYENMWFTENKPHGFDVQDIRIGGLLQRLKSCKRRLLLLADGKITNIPELEEPVLTEMNGRSWWENVVTANNL